MTRDDDRSSRGILSRLLRRRRDEPEVPTSGLFTARTVPVPPPDEPPAERLFDGVADAGTEPREPEQVDAEAVTPEKTEPDIAEPGAIDAEPVASDVAAPGTPTPEPEVGTGDASLTDLADELHRYVTQAPTDDVWDEDDLPGARVPDEPPHAPPGDNLFRAPTRTVGPAAPSEPAEVDDVLDVLDRGWPDDEPSWVDTATEPDWEDDAPPPPAAHTPGEEPAPERDTSDPDERDLQVAAATALWEHEEDESTPPTEAAPAEPVAVTPAEPEPETETEPEPWVAEASEPRPEAAAEPEPDVEVAPEPEVEPEPEIARVPIGEDPPLHGPKQIRVYDDRLDRRPGPIQMSPSEAVALAKDGPSALHRRTRRED